MVFIGAHVGGIHPVGLLPQSVTPLQLMTVVILMMLVHYLNKNVKIIAINFKQSSASA